MARNPISPALLSRWLGQEHLPTEQQADVIGDQPGPLLVVAGAGAGKTETMAARVVWLVANGFATPDQILGLTFTKKAAQQLSQRIRARLATLAGIPRLADLDPTGELQTHLQAITPTVSTYDSYAGRIVGEYGLLLPVEPSSRMITTAELYQIAWDVVGNYTGHVDATVTHGTVTDRLISLVSEMDGHMVSAADIEAETEPFVRLFDELPKGPRQRDKLNAAMLKIRDTQLARLDYLPLVRQLKEEMAERGVITFGEQMSLAATVAQRHPVVGRSQRQRFRVVMLDEYQDTSHAQRVLLSSLFGAPTQAGAPDTAPDVTVTAVGDPMQAIYGWRGATSANLERFVTDFPQHAETPTPAPKKELTTSWRNPGLVLDCANTVSEQVLGPAGSPTRTVQPLTPRPGAGDGEVALGWFPTRDEERTWVARRLADEFHAYRERGEKFTGAVLVRKNADSGPIAEELRALGIPVEIVGLSGLLDIPEVADMVACATILISPQNTAAALRLLCGPHCNLGIADLQALYKRSRTLAARVTTPEDTTEQPTLFDISADDPDATNPTDPLEHLKHIIDDATSTVPEAAVGLGDALGDLGEPEAYSPEGYRRLSELSAELRHLRTRSLTQPLPDLFADIERVLGIRTEVLARENPQADGAAGTVHLDRFHEEVAQFSTIPGSTLASLLDYFRLARTHDRGLAPGEVRVKGDCVQILTVHKAKGLEWKVVAVLHADNVTYADTTTPGQQLKVPTWLSDVTQIPSTLRGDAQEQEGDMVGSPVLDVSEVEDRKQFEVAMNEHKAAFKEAAIEEASRLFYVALTRAEKTLCVTASESNDKGGKAKPYSMLDLLRKRQPDSVEQWWDESNADAELAEAPDVSPVTGVFPQDFLGERRPAVEQGAELVRRAMQQLPTPSADNDVEALWEEEVTALIEEHERMKAPVVDVPLGQELTASDVVSIARNQEQYARRLRRPVPFKPNAYAKRGTALHQWLEDYFGASSLLDEDELPGFGEDEDPQGAELERLKKAFLASQWADRTPTHVEQPFEIVVGGRVLRGRMDAVFHEGDDPEAGWMVVDWKTGRPPEGQEMRAAEIQLAVYRVAWAQLLSHTLGRSVNPDAVRAAFHYIASDRTFEPSRLPNAEELADLLDIKAPQQTAQPSASGPATPDSPQTQTQRRNDA